MTPEKYFFPNSSHSSQEAIHNIYQNNLFPSPDIMIVVSVLYFLCYCIVCDFCFVLIVYCTIFVSALLLFCIRLRVYTSVARCMYFLHLSDKLNSWILWRSNPVHKTRSSVSVHLKHQNDGGKKWSQWLEAWVLVKDNLVWVFPENAHGISHPAVSRVSTEWLW